MWMAKPGFTLISWNVLSDDLRERSAKQPDSEMKLLSSLFAIPLMVANQAPLSMVFCRQEYWMGHHFLLQGSFLTWGSNLGCLNCRQMLYPLSHQGGPPDSLKSQLLKEAVLGLKSRMSLCVFPVGCMLQLYRFHRANDWFLTSYLNSRFTKHVSLWFQSFVNSFLGLKLWSMYVVRGLPSKK